MSKNVVWCGPVDGANQKPNLFEGLATEAAILPGSVIDQAAAGAGIELMDDAATVFGKPLLVADKNNWQMKSMADAWTINESMMGIKPRSGELLNVFVVTGQALLVGTALTRSVVTPGALVIAATDGTEEILCHADEAVTTTGTQLVRVEVS